MAGPAVATGQVERLIDETASYAAANPAVTAGVVLAALALLVVLWIGLRWYRRPAGAKLHRVLSNADVVSVLMHPNPDPDAMAAAIGVAHLADRADTEAHLQYTGEIRHQENRAFRTVLDLDLSTVETAADVEGDALVLVDHNEPRGFDGSEGVRPDAVIDHHPGGGTGRTFTDVRPDYGAAATIVAEYCEELDIQPAQEADPEVEDPLPQTVATGLLYGILADTNHLTKGTSPAEFSASAYLSAGIDEDALDRIANPQVDAEVLDVKARAITDRRVEGPFAVSHVGDVSNVDAIPQAADELLHLEGVGAVVVTGRKDGTLHLSGRSRDDRVHMGRVLERVVDDIPMSSAGGHARMGGGQLSIDHMEGLGPSDGVSIEDLHDRLLEGMTGEQ
ncbi:MAG: bifunctional oligoribonuclease/PAP phosphatase NrnA [Halanaeroarchaeum sp.]